MGDVISSTINGKKVVPEKKKNEYSAFGLAKKLQQQKIARKKLMDSMPK